jgi:hypothetical protein
MNNLLRTLLVVMVSLISSCAMIFNEKEVELSIKSTPPGADIFIEGRNYGRTPAVIKIIPDNYTVVLNKAGYGSTQIQVESWATIRKKSGEKARCIADSLGVMFVLPAYSAFFSGKCDDFKQPEYSAIIPFLGGGMMDQNSMMGVGHNPQEMINYHYQPNNGYRNQNNGYGGNYGNSGYSKNSNSNNPYRRY